LKTFEEEYCLADRRSALDPSTVGKLDRERL
jgi:hypothetical protein